MNHWIGNTVRRNCKSCTEEKKYNMKASYICKKCNVPLHVNCFEESIVFYAYLHTCIHTYTYTYIHTYRHRYLHTYVHTYIPAYIHSYILTYIHTYIIFFFKSMQNYNTSLRNITLSNSYVNNICV